MFLGTHNPRLDEKGRVILPSRFRRELAGGLVLTKGQERCLVVWPKDEFENEAVAMRAPTRTAPEDRLLARVFFAGAQDEDLDSQGRMTIPPALREYAQLDRELAVIGADNKIEIWDAQAWTDYLAGADDVFSSLDGELSQ